MAIQTGTGDLWYLRYNINTETRGFNLKFHIVGTDETAIMAHGSRIAGHIKSILPTDAEIFYACYGKVGAPRDAGFLEGAPGVGTYQIAGTPPVDSKYDYSKTAVLVRLENTVRRAVNLKFAPIPDDICTEGALGANVPAVKGTPTGAIPTTPTTDNWYNRFNLFLQYIVQNTHYVQSKRNANGSYNYDNWKNAYVSRVGDKKGGRVFGS